MIMEDKRTEAEKCNGWLRKMSAFNFCVFYCCGEGGYDEDVYEDFKRRVKEDYSPWISKYLKSLESNDTKQRKKTILSIISYFDKKFFVDSDYPTNYQYAISNCCIRGFFKYCRIKIKYEDPRLFWFRKLIKEDISEVEICRMLLTCQELEEYEIGISLGQEYVEYMKDRLSDLSMSLVNKHIGVLQEELNYRNKRGALADMDSMDITDYRDYIRELEEESWEAMTGGMYGDYDGDIDMDKLGY